MLSFLGEKCDSCRRQIDDAAKHELGHPNRPWYLGVIPGQYESIFCSRECWDAFQVWLDSGA